MNSAFPCGRKELLSNIRLIALLCQIVQKRWFWRWRTVSPTTPQRNQISKYIRVNWMLSDAITIVTVRFGWLPDESQNIWSRLDAYLCNAHHCRTSWKHILWCDVAAWYVMLCYAMLCYAIICYVMICYVMLWHVMLLYVMLCKGYDDLSTAHRISDVKTELKFFSLQSELFLPFNDLIRL